MWVDIEDKDNIAAVDTKSLTVTAITSSKARAADPAAWRSMLRTAFCSLPATIPP